MNKNLLKNVSKVEAEKKHKLQVAIVRKKLVNLWFNRKYHFLCRTIMMLHFNGFNLGNKKQDIIKLQIPMTFNKESGQLMSRKMFELLINFRPCLIKYIC